LDILEFELSDVAGFMLFWIPKSLVVDDTVDRLNVLFGNPDDDTVDRLNWLDFGMLFIIYILTDRNYILYIFIIFWTPFI